MTRSQVWLEETGWTYNMAVKWLTVLPTCFSSQRRASSAAQIPHSQCHWFWGSARTKSRLYYTCHHLFSIHISELLETKQAKNLICWRWEMDGKQRCHGKHICSLKANFIPASKGCFVLRFCPLVPRPKQIQHGRSYLHATGWRLQ